MDTHTAACSTPSICNYSEPVVLFSWLFDRLSKQCHCILPTWLSGGAVCIVAEQGSFKLLTHLVTGWSPCAYCCPLCLLNQGICFTLSVRQLGPIGSFKTRLCWIWWQTWEQNLALNASVFYLLDRVTYALQIALNLWVCLWMLLEAIFATFAVCIEFCKTWRKILV